MNPSSPHPGKGVRKATAASQAARDPVAKARHDLRNPIAHILGFSEMAMEKAQELGFNHLKSRLEVINRTANQMLELVNQGLDAAKIESGLSDLPALQQQLRRHSSKIITVAEPLTRKSRKLAGDLFASDLERIISSARHFLELAGSCLAFAAPPPRERVPPGDVPACGSSKPL